MNATAHALTQVASATPVPQAANTPESFKVRFEEIQSSAVLTSASEFAQELYWNTSGVCVEGGFDSFRMALRALCKENELAYSALLRKSDALFEDIADWHDHVDDEREDEIKSWGTR